MSLLGAAGIKLMENASLIIVRSRLWLSNACKGLIPVQQIYAFISPDSMRFKHTFKEGWVFKCFILDFLTVEGDFPNILFCPYLLLFHGLYSKSKICFLSAGRSHCSWEPIFLFLKLFSTLWLFERPTETRRKLTHPAGGKTHHQPTLTSVHLCLSGDRDTMLTLFFSFVSPGAGAAGTAASVKYPRQMVQHQHLLLGVSSRGSKRVPPAQPTRHRLCLDVGHLLNAQFKNYLMESNIK